MKFLAFILALVFTATAVNAAPSTHETDVRELERLETVWNEAHERGDAAALDALWADDLVVAVPRMKVMTKADALSFARSGRMKFLRYRTSDLRVRVYDNAAVVTGRLQRTRSSNGHEISDDWRFTKVYVRQGNQWRVVAFHASEAAGTTAQEPQHQHSDSMHHDAMNARGEKAMGFSQTATTHHFTLLPDGGYIQVQANSADDTMDRDHIRMHLQQQARRFSAGDFSAPELTHDVVPPGVPVMQEMSSAITYRYEEIERGGRLRISSKDPIAISAIHDFLKFQIADHETGDPSTVSAN
jgi:ketosteroid isomerase-like protein